MSLLCLLLGLVSRGTLLMIIKRKILPEGNVGPEPVNKPLPSVLRSHINHPSIERIEPVLNILLDY